MAKAADPTYVRALRTFWGGLGSRDIRIEAGDIFAADHPAVKKWPDAFAPIVIRGLDDGPRIEQATAAPGEKRGA